MTDFVIITGCDSGIGKSTAEHLAGNGWGVVACVYDFTPEIEQWANDVSRVSGSEVLLQTLDLRSSDSIKTTVRNIKAQGLSITSLINVAGVTNDALISMSRRQDILDVFEVNVFGQIEFTQFCLKILNRKVRRSIVFVSSTAAISGGVGQLAYASSKAAISNVTKTFARELGPTGVNVNAVAPGVIDTKMNQTVSVDIIKDRLRNTSLQRMGKPIEVAKVIEFLISEFSAHVSGQVIRVDGGLL